MERERSAILIHSYLNDKSGKDRPDRLTRLGILSALELYRHGEVDAIFITVEQNQAASMVKQVKNLLGNIPTVSRIPVLGKFITVDIPEMLPGSKFRLQTWLLKHLEKS